MTHIWANKLTIIGSDLGLSPDRHRGIIWTNAGILLGTSVSEILIKIYTFSFKTMHLKMSFGKWRPSCLGLNVLTSDQMYAQPILLGSSKTNETATTICFNSLMPSDAYICVGNLTTIGSDNGLSPGRPQAINWTNRGIFVDWMSRNKRRWSFNRKSNNFIQEIAFQKVF